MYLGIDFSGSSIILLVSCARNPNKFQYLPSAWRIQKLTVPSYSVFSHIKCCIFYRSKFLIELKFFSVWFLYDSKGTNEPWQPDPPPQIPKSFPQCHDLMPGLRGSPDTSQGFSLPRLYPDKRLAELNLHPSLSFPREVPNPQSLVYPGSWLCFLSDYWIIKLLTLLGLQFQQKLCKQHILTAW